MSRCKKCNRTFAEENGWQEFCSLTCAQRYVIGRTVQELDMTKKRDADDFARWVGWFTNTKNARRVRPCDEPEPAPKVGKFEERVVEWREGKKKKLVRLRVNVGSEVTVRPMTEEERKQIVRGRGRGGFADGHAYNPMCEDLPSVHGQVGRGWFPHD